MLALYPLWRKARRVYSLTSRLPGTNRLGFQPSLALSGSNVIKRINENITLLANVEYIQASNAVKESPLTDRHDQWSAYVGIFYQF
ncbi:MAG: MipA/OmpV family protein [Candidatus Thiodiazotropha sp. L084R]